MIGYFHFSTRPRKREVLGKLDDVGKSVFDLREEFAKEYGVEAASFRYMRMLAKMHRHAEALTRKGYAERAERPLPGEATETVYKLTEKGAATRDRPL